MPQLTAPQLERLQTALLDAFDQAELTQWVYLALNQRLENIASDGSFQETVANVVQWAQRQERVGDLGGRRAEIRRALEGLKKNPFPDWVRKVEAHKPL